MEQHLSWRARLLLDGKGRYIVCELQVTQVLSVHENKVCVARGLLHARYNAHLAGSC